MYYFWYWAISLFSLAIKSLSPKGLTGEVEAAIYIKGYNPEVLKARNVTKEPKALPKPNLDEDDEEMEDEEVYEAHGHELVDYLYLEVNINTTVAHLNFPPKFRR